MTLFGVQDLRQVFSDRADNIALIDYDTDSSLTYRALLSDMIDGANMLGAQGANKGDIICFVCENSFRMIRLIFSAWQRGCVVMPINPDLSSAYIQKIITDNMPKLIIADDTGRDTMNNDGIDFSRTSVPDALCLSGLPAFGSDLPEVNTSTAKLFESLDGDAVFLRIFTSGSTAAPKGVNFRLNNLLANEYMFSKHIGVSKDDRFYNFFPFSYLAGIHNLLLLPLVNGASIVIGKPLGGARMYSLWDDVRKHEISALWFTGAMLSMILMIRADGDESWIADQINLGIVGMAPLSEAVRLQFEDRFGFKLLENYALSETTFISTQVKADRSADGISKGQILDNVTVEVMPLDLDASMLVENQIVGELFIRSPFVCAGYSGASQKDVANFQNGGFLTGDIGYVDKGRIFLVGRKKELIIRGGLNIAPALVEREVAELSYVSDVCAFALPNELWGEIVACAVVLKDQNHSVDVNTLRIDLGSTLAAFQKPERLFLMDELPQGLTGKIDRRKLAAMHTS